MRGRRRVLQASGVLLSSLLAGCDIGEFPGGGSGSDAGSVGASVWGSPRGGPHNRGYAPGSGPSGDATDQWDTTWQSGYGRPVDPPPVLGEKRLYVLVSQSDYSVSPPAFGLELRAYARSDGEAEWTTTLVERTGEEYVGYVGRAAHAVTDDGLFVARVTGTDHALTISKHDPTDGSVTWTASGRGPANDFRGPRVGPDAIFVQRSTLDAYSRSDGSPNWSTDEDVLPTALAPAVGQATVVTTGQTDSRSYAFGYDSASGEERWRTELRGRGRSYPTITGDLVLVPEGHLRHPQGPPTPDAVPSARLRALALSDGAEQWHFEPATDDGMHELVTTGAVAVADSKVYLTVGLPRGDPVRAVLGEGGDINPSNSYSIYALNRSDGSVEWRRRIGPYPDLLMPPIITDDRVFVMRSARDVTERALVLEASSGDTVGQFSIPTHEGFPAVEDGMVYFQTASGLRAYG